jgi:hypothetical protein
MLAIRIHIKSVLCSKRDKSDIISQDKESKPLNKPTSHTTARQGEAILQTLTKNHHMASPDTKFFKLLLINKLHLPTYSYEKL